MASLTKRVVDAAKPQAKDYFIWCDARPGFGVRIYPSGRKVFIAQVRVGLGPGSIKRWEQADEAMDRAARPYPDR